MRAKTQVERIEEIRELYRRLGMKRWGWADNLSME